MNDAKIQQMHLALKRITKYQSPQQLRRFSEKEYGLTYEEALEMAYENVITEAKNGLRGVRLTEAASQRTEGEGQHGK